MPKVTRPIGSRAGTRAQVCSFQSSTLPTAPHCWHLPCYDHVTWLTQPLALLVSSSPELPTRQPRKLSTFYTLSHLLSTITSKGVGCMAWAVPISTPTRQQPPLPHGGALSLFCRPPGFGKGSPTESGRQEERRSPVSLASGSASGSGGCRGGDHEHLGFGPDILVPGAANSAAQTSSHEQ